MIYASNSPRSPTFRPSRPRFLSSDSLAKPKTSNCLSILLMVTFFVVGSILSPLHICGEMTSRRTEFDPQQQQHQFTRHPITIRTRSYNNTDPEQDDETVENDDFDAGEQVDGTLFAREEDISISLPIPPQTNFSGILARPFGSWTHPLPCYEPEENWKGMEVSNSPAKNGFLFVKPYKTGSSTTSGINLRIARNVAIRQGTNHEICKGMFTRSVTESISNALVVQL